MLHVALQELPNHSPMTDRTWWNSVAWVVRVDGTWKTEDVVEEITECPIELLQCVQHECNLLLWSAARLALGFD